MTTFVRIVARVYLAVLYRRTAVPGPRRAAGAPAGAERAVPTSFYPLA